MQKWRRSDEIWLTVYVIRVSYFSTNIYAIFVGFKIQILLQFTQYELTLVQLAVGTM